MSDKKTIEKIKKIKKIKKIGDKHFDHSAYLSYQELHQNNAGLTLTIDKLHESRQSEFQTIEVIENKTFGKMLVLYGSLMVADNDNNAYNEMLTHVALFSHPSPKKVLIIGGGDCGALTEITKHPEVESITMCEIDEMVVEVSKKHFPHLTEGISDPRVTMLFEDGKKFIEDSNEKYDVIILDLSDPVGPAAELFEKDFHQSVCDRLNDDGIMVAQSEAPLFDQEIIKTMYGHLNSIFPLVKMYTCHMPIYPSALWSFAFCSRRYSPERDFDSGRWEKLKLKTRYYNAEVHRAAFALPQFIKDLLGEG